MIETELAPHQRLLAELVDSRKVSAIGGQTELPPPDTGPADGLRAGWLTELKHDPARALQGLERTVQEHRGDAAQSKMLADLAMRFSVNNDAATPEYPGLRPCGSPGARPVLTRAGRLWRLCPEHRAAGDRLQAVPAPDGMPETCDFPLPAEDPAAFCDFCGNSDPRDLEPGVDGPERPEMACRDDLLDECVARRERRYPPDLSRVPSWVFEAQARLTDASTRQMIMAATAAALSDYLALVAQEGDELELSQPPAGVWNTRGDWFPWQPAYNINWAHINWSHTIRGGAPMHRTIANQQLTPARISAMAAVQSARQAKDGSGGGQARHEIPPTGNPPGVAEALHGGVGHDIQLQQPELPEAAPQRSARRPQYGRRRGRKAAFPRRTLKYQGRR